MKVVILPSAKADLERIAETIAQDSPRRAATFAAELAARCATLSEQPERFPLVSRYASLGIRRLVHGNYLVFYAVGDEGVSILHVLHGRRDIDHLLFPRPPTE